MDAVRDEHNRRDIDSATAAEPGIWYSLNKRQRWMNVAKLTDVEQLSDAKRLVTARVKKLN
jgi:hypothetical protein